MLALLGKVESFVPHRASLWTSGEQSSRLFPGGPSAGPPGEIRSIFPRRASF